MDNVSVLLDNDAILGMDPTQVPLPRRYNKLLLFINYFGWLDAEDQEAKQP